MTSTKPIDPEVVTLVRNGLFLAPSRSYAEQYIEPLIRDKYSLLEPSGNDHDALDEHGIRYEIKASKVLRESGNTAKLKSLYERIIFENLNLETSRLIPFSEAKKAEYGANIQNVKRDHFKYLFYVLLFEDVLKVFKCENTDIESIPNWSGKHGRYDALGKSGQFALNKRNINWHVKNHLIDTFNYEEATRIFMKLSEPE